MTQDGETDGYDADDHVRAILEHAGPGVMDVCIANDAPVPPEIMEPYAKEGVSQLELRREEVGAAGRCCARRSRSLSRDAISATTPTRWHARFCRCGGNSETETSEEANAVMSFSSNVKQELCRLPINRKLRGAAAELYGVLLYCNTFSQTDPHHHRRVRDFAARLPRLFKKVVRHLVRPGACGGGPGKLQFAMGRRTKSQKIFETLQMDLKARVVTLHVNFGMLEEDEEWMAYLRGAFLAGGSVTDPAKRYHLEMTTSHYKVSRETCALLIECGFSPKEMTRGGNSILYFKQSD